MEDDSEVDSLVVVPLDVIGATERTAANKMFHLHCTVYVFKKPQQRNKSHRLLRKIRQVATHNNVYIYLFHHHSRYSYFLNLNPYHHNCSFRQNFRWNLGVILLDEIKKAQSDNSELQY